MQNRNPKVDIPVSGGEIWMHRSALALIGFSAMLILFNYSDLPDRIPIHFDALGNPDSWSEKAMIWVVPMMMGATVWLLQRISKMPPHQFNYAIEITKENAAYYYKKTRYALALMNLVIGGITLLLTWQMLNIALGNATKFGAWTVPAILIAIAIPIVIMVYPPYSKD